MTHDLTIYTSLFANSPQTELGGLTVTEFLDRCVDDHEFILTATELAIDLEIELVDVLASLRRSFTRS